MRSASPDTFAIVDVQNGELLGTTEGARAPSTVHPGAVYLHGGRWNGRQLVPSAYVHDATRRHTNLGAGWGYGYGWWVLGGRPHGFAALGYGGQAIAVYPQQQLVIVVTGSGDRMQRVLDGLVLPGLGIR